MRSMKTTLWATLALACSASAAVAAEGGTPNVFKGSPYQTAAAIISFGILMVLLKKFAWGPMLAGLQAREDKIRTDLHSAEEAAKAAAATLEQYKKQLADAHAEARKLNDQARVDSEALRNRLVNETNVQIDILRKRATEEIEMAKQKALTEIYAQAAELATSVAGKILQRQVNDSDTQSLVQQSLSELSRLQ